jgi:hypothetical protein
MKTFEPFASLRAGSWNVDTFECLDGGLLSVHGDPPFVGDGAEALIVSEQVFDFQG